MAETTSTSTTSTTSATSTTSSTPHVRTILRELEDISRDTDRLCCILVEFTIVNSAEVPHSRKYLSFPNKESFRLYFGFISDKPITDVVQSLCPILRHTFHTGGCDRPIHRAPFVLIDGNITIESPGFAKTIRTVGNSKKYYYFDAKMWKKWFG